MTNVLRCLLVASSIVTLLTPKVAEADPQAALVIVAEDPAATKAAFHLRQIMAGRTTATNVTVTIDGVAGRIGVFDPAVNRTVGRNVEPATMARDPYAAAMIAAELIDLSRTREPPPRSTPAVVAKPAPLAPIAPWQIEVMGAAALGAAIGGDARVVSPMLGLGVSRPIATAWRLAGGFSVQPWGQDRFTLPQGRAFRYRRDEALAYLGAQTERGKLNWFVGAVGGVARVEARAEGVVPLADNELVLGGRLRVSHQIFRRFDVAVWLDVLGVPSPLQYQTGGATVYKETPMWVRGGLGILWQADLGL